MEATLLSPRPPTRPSLLRFLPIYVSVVLYISVGFLDVSALPSFLAFVAKRDNPDADEDTIAVTVATHLAACNLSLGVTAVLVAGWAGRLSDRFGRRRCAALPAVGQAIGMLLLSIATSLRLDWRYILAAWTTMGVFGGPFVFLAAAFAYMADFTSVAGRGRAFASLDSLLLFVAALGPVVGALLVDTIGFAGVWAVCALAYFLAAGAFLLAPPSPQPLPKPAKSPCREWACTSTPMLLLRMLRNKEQRALCLAFTLALGAIQGGLSCFILYSQRFLGWGQELIGLYVSAYSLCGATLIAVVHPILSRLARRRISDLTMVRCAYFGPAVYLSVIGFVPSTLGTTVAFGMIPLLATAVVATPHFRALFSQTQTAAEQGSVMSLIAALESLPQLYASPLGSLGFSRTLPEPWPVFVVCGAVALAALLMLWTCVPSPPVMMGGDVQERGRIGPVESNETAGPALRTRLAGERHEPLPVQTERADDGTGTA